MITSGFSLAFNGKALLNNSKEMLWQRDIYQVTTSTDGHGSITASPMSGYQGTTVSLSNTPNANYSFTGYSVTGATLTGNQFTLNNDVTAHAGFIRPTSGSLYVDNTEHDITAYNGSYTYNMNLDVSNYDYCVISLDEHGPNPAEINAWANNITLNNWNYQIRNHYTLRDVQSYFAGKGLQNGSSSLSRSAFTMTNDNTDYKYIDGHWVYYAKNVAESAWGTRIYILDRANGILSAAINNTVYGHYDYMSKNITSLSNIYCNIEMNSPMYLKNCKVNGFNSLTAINDYYSLH